MLDEPTVGRGISMLQQAAMGFSGQPPSPPWLDLDLDLDIHELDSAPAAPANNKVTSSVGSGSHKKQHHNEYERDRRKLLNEMYSSLRSLLPDADHTKKLSIPTTVCQVLEYIPKLQNEVENLEKRKEALTRAKCKAPMLPMNDRTTPIVSATPLDAKNIVIQVSLLKNMAENLPLSKCIQVLEKEGLQLISSSTFSTFDVNRTFYSLHLQKSHGTLNKECPTLICDKLEKVVKEKPTPHLE